MNKNIENAERNRSTGAPLENILMVFVIISYIATVVFLVMQMTLPLAIAFAFQTILTLTLFIHMRSAAIRKDIDVDVLSINTQYNQNQYENKIKENHTLTQTINNLNMELSGAASKIEEQEKTIVELNNKIADLEKQEEDSNDLDINTLLPHLSEEEKNLPSINIIDIAKEVVKELDPSAKKNGIQIQVATASESLLVKAAPSRIRILFRNIIDNSIKYMQKSGVLVITISNIGTDIFIVLKDNGKGLESAETNHIFELNYQGSNRVSGNGLGLAQSKAIVEYYGGTIYAKSNSNQGMGVYIQLPLT